MRKGFTLIAAILLALTGSLAIATPALAFAQKCTWAPYGLVCNSTYGNGDYVAQISAIRDKANAEMICNYSAHISVLDGRNTANVKYFRSFYHAGCTPGRAYFNTYPQRHFACGDITSVAWWENGVRQGGYANVRLC
jgi:hypothetical protein